MESFSPTKFSQRSAIRFTIAGVRSTPDPLGNVVGQHRDADGAADLDVMVDQFVGGGLQ